MLTLVACQAIVLFHTTKSIHSERQDPIEFNVEFKMINLYLKLDCGRIRFFITMAVVVLELRFYSV